MKYIYFTKGLRGLDLPRTAEFLRAAGFQGADLAVRPGYPVDPDNVEKMLPEAKKVLAEQGLSIPLVSTPTNLNDADRSDAARIFEACAASGVPFVKVGYFPYGGNYERDFSGARKRLDGFARLAEKTGVRACIHTHSGGYIGANCEGLRPLLEGHDPHRIGAYVDTGHQSVRGTVFRPALDMVSQWFCLLAIKDMLWKRSGRHWSYDVVVAGEGIVDWPEVRKALADRRFDGVVSLHGEYDVKDLADRTAKARTELEFLKRKFV